MTGASQRSPLVALRVAVSRVAVLVGVVLAAGCDRRPEPARADSTPAPPRVDSAPAPTPVPTSTWDPDAGVALLVAAEDAAIVVVPGSSDGTVTDTSSGRAESVLPADVSLFTRAGSAGQARAVLASAPSGDVAGDCTTWPSARVGPASGADAVPRWTVGFVGGHAAPIPLDSLEGLSSADSAALTTALARAAAGLPGDTARRLRGLPFAVQQAHRFSPEPGVDAYVAVLARTVNQEASPFAERVLLVAERAHGSTGPLTVAYHERAIGDNEESIQAPGVLAAVRLGAEARPTLVLSREYYEGSAYTLLERAGGGRWRVRWTSVYNGC